MKHENEIIDSRLATRIICGVLAAAGIGAIIHRVIGVIASGHPDGWFFVQLLGAGYGLFLFTTYALTGKLPFLPRQR